VDKLETLPINSGDTSLLAFSNTLLDVFKANLSADRLLLPLLELLAFLLDMQILQRLITTTFKYVSGTKREPPLQNPFPLNTSSNKPRWRTVISFVQKSHYKSNSIPKLHAALATYRGLADIAAIRDDVLAKVTSMLLHPFPKVRSRLPHGPMQQVLHLPVDCSG